LTDLDRQTERDTHRGTHRSRETERVRERDTHTHRVGTERRIYKERCIEAVLG